MNKTDYIINNYRDTRNREGGAFLNQYVSLSRFSFETNMVIYKATNLLSGKVYIGQTIKTLKQRKLGHLRYVDFGGDCYFHRAIRKYGVDNFKWEVICICPNIDSLNEREQHYIALYDSMNNGYNLTNGGKNYEISDEHKEKLSQANLGRKVSEETKEKIRQSLLGHTVSKESRKKMRQIALNMSDETKEKMRQAQLGKKKSKETLKKIRGKNHWNYGNRRKDAPNYGKHLSKEAIEKRSGENNWNYGKRGKETSMYGRHHTKEAKRKMSENNARYWLGKTLSKEHKQKLSKNHADVRGKKNPNYGRKHTNE